MFSAILLLSRKVKLAILAVCLFFVFGIFYCYHFNGCKRLKFIIDIPIVAFDKDGHLTDQNWIKFLSYYKPVGIIFFDEHLQNKKVARQMIADIKSVIGEEDLFIAADEEGGRVNRMKWIDVMSASEIAEKYLQLKRFQNENVAKMFVEEEYSKMFQEMHDIGLNLDFAPNLDINIYEHLRDTNEYLYYKQAEKYIKIAKKRRSKLSDDEKIEYAKTMMFYAYLDEVGIKSLDNFSIDGKISDDGEIEMIRSQWKNLDKSQKNSFISDFEHVSKYANYASVVGDRSFGDDPVLIAEIADIFVKTAKKFGIKCTIKHLLGHGRALGDTHNGTEYIDTPISVILQDLYPYKMLINEVNFAMPADIVYLSVDSEKSAMDSEKVLNFFRKHIGKTTFVGDDLVVRDGNIIKQKCDIHMKIRNQSVDDVLQFIKDEDYVGQGVWKSWFN